MDVDAPLAVARLVAELGKVEGRKRLQKIVHLLGAKRFPQFRQRFVLHYYGPFSRQLARDLDFLSDAGLIDERLGASGGYAYSVSPSGKKFFEELDRDDQDSQPWAEFAHKLNGRDTELHDTELLEAVSTLVFLGANGTDDEALEGRFAEVKPKLSSRFPEARRFAEELALPSSC